jgi:hypothetical protein
MRSRRTDSPTASEMAMNAIPLRIPFTAVLLLDGFYGSAGDVW